MKHRSTTLFGTMAFAAAVGFALVASPASADQGAVLKKAFVAGSQIYSGSSTSFVASKINPVAGANNWNLDDNTTRLFAVNNTWTKIGRTGKTLDILVSKTDMSLAKRLMSSAAYYGTPAHGFINLEVALAAHQGGWVDSL